MKIKLNGAEAETGASNMAELCQNLGYDKDAKIATALSGEFIPRSKRSDCRLAENDDVEIVAPRQGG